MLTEHDANRSINDVPMRQPANAAAKALAAPVLIVVAFALAGASIADSSAATLPPAHGLVAAQSVVALSAPNDRPESPAPELKEVALQAVIGNAPSNVRFMSGINGHFEHPHDESGPGGLAGGGDGDMPPSVLLIALDDLNDWIGVLGGHPQALTPNIDALAARGMVFERAYCPAPWCCPSRAALLTGIRPSTSGVFSNSIPWRTGHIHSVTMPRHFADNGYHVGRSRKMFHKNYPDHSSWHEQFECTGSPGHQVPLNGIEELAALSIDWGPINAADGEWSEVKGAQQAIAFIDEAATDEPFFLGVGFMAQHFPWYAPPRFFDLHPLEDVVLPEVLENDADDLPNVANTFIDSEIHDIILQYDVWEEAVQAYLATISFVDEYIGQVVEAVDNSPHADNTIIVLWSDHGHMLGEKTHWGKATAWEDVMRSPLIFVAPGVTIPGSVAHQPVSLIDIYPTLVELCGLPARPELEGVSLVPIMQNPAILWNRPAVGTVKPNMHTVRSLRWHYIRYANGDEELYDHHVDPHEWNNLAEDPQYASVIDWLNDSLPIINRPQVPVSPTVLFVDKDAQGVETGNNWPNAFSDLQTALTLAADNLWVREIWVKEGTYRPAPPNGDRRANFRLAENVRVYGGFDGTEITRTQRKPYKNITILSGDLNNDDGPNFANTSDNSYHVVTCGPMALGDPTGITAGLDGFTITGGNADGDGWYAHGGGIYIDHGSPTISRCKFIANRADGYGGAAYASGGSLPASGPIFETCLLANNHADEGGGGLYADYFSPTWTACTFSTVGPSQPKLNNCTIRRNTTDGLAGGVGAFGTSSPRLSNTIAWNNMDSSGLTESAQISGGIPTVNFCCILGWSGSLSGVGSFGNDPLFLSQMPGDTRVDEDSPCFNAGDPTIPNPVGVRDVAGNARIACGRVDVGAFEYGVGDYTVNGRVRLDDFNHWPDCVTGPQGGVLDEECHRFDGDYNEIIDLRDAASFMRIFDCGTPFGG